MKRVIIFILSLCIVLSLSACDTTDDVFSFNMEDENTPSKSSEQEWTY